MIKPGETATVSIMLSSDSFAHFDVVSNAWKADRGDYDLDIGTSSRDLPVTERATW